MNVESGEFLSIQGALALMLRIENIRKKSVFTKDRILLGVAHAGTPQPTVKCGYIKDLMEADFGAPPYTLIVPGELHFMEVRHS